MFLGCFRTTEVDTMRALYRQHAFSQDLHPSVILLEAAEPVVLLDLRAAIASFLVLESVLLLLRALHASRLLSVLVSLQRHVGILLVKSMESHVRFYCISLVQDATCALRIKT